MLNIFHCPVDEAKKPANYKLVDNCDELDKDSTSASVVWSSIFWDFLRIDEFIYTLIKSNARWEWLMMLLLTICVSFAISNETAV